MGTGAGHLAAALLRVTGHSPRSTEEAAEGAFVLWTRATELQLKLAEASNVAH